MNRFILLLTLVSVITQYTSAATVFENTFLDYDWGSNCTQEEFNKTGEYNPKVCIPSKLAVGKDISVIYVTVPRVYSAYGVPSSLNTIHTKHGTTKTGELSPYPSWDMNRMGDCAAIQNAVSLYFDRSNDNLFVLDTGGVADYTDQPVNQCPPKIVVLDTSDGSVVSVHELPDSVVPRDKSFLIDFVIDFVDGIGDARYAYIADAKLPQIVVYDFNTNKTWSFKHQSMNFDEDSVVEIVGQKYNLSMGVSGLAISSSYRYLYYSALGSSKLWQIPISVLRDEHGQFDLFVRLVGNKMSNSVALVSGRKGLYYGALGLCAVIRWDWKADMEKQGVLEGSVMLETETPLAQNYATMQYLDGLCFAPSSTGELVFISTKGQKAKEGTMDFTGGDGKNNIVFKQFFNDSDAREPSDNPY